MGAIVQKDNPVLRQLAEPVPPEEITSTRIQKVIADMKAALADEADGVGLAAPQIGVPLRIFVVSKRAFELAEEEGTPIGKIPEDDLVFIDPEITSCSKKKTAVPEGCLSVRWLYGNTERAEKATIRAYDEHGKQFQRGATGLLAHIFQHEVDHLNGILFIDHAKDIEEMRPEDIEKQ